MNLLRHAITLILLTTPFSSASAKGGDERSARIKAASLYYIAAARIDQRKSSSEVAICFLSPHPIRQRAEEMLAGKRIGDRIVRVRYDTSQECEVIFLGEGEKENKIYPSSITVREGKTLADVMIFEASNKLRIAVSRQALEEKKIMLQQEFLSTDGVMVVE